MTMYHSAALAQKRTIRRNRNATRYRTDSHHLGPLANIVMISIMIGVLGMLYLTQIAKSASYSYQVDELKERKEQLIAENERLQLESTRLQALERIKTSKIAKSLEDVQSVDYASVE